MIKLMTPAFVLFFAYILIAGPPTDNGAVFTITRCTFDEESLTVHLSWKADSAVLKEDIFAGISAASDPRQVVQPLSSFRCTSLFGDTAFTIPELAFDTLYTIALWTKRAGAWITPDSLSTCVVRIQSRFKQPVSYFNPSRRDTVKALMGSVRLWKGPDYPAGMFPSKDTVVSFSPSDSILGGFASFGSGVRFLHPAPSLAFFIALKCDSAFMGRWSKNLRCYRDSAGILLVIKNAQTDSVNKWIYFKTSDLKFPFVMLADTVHPEYRLLSDTSVCIDSVPLVDSFSVIDNSPRVSWEFYCARGGDAFASPVSSGYAPGASGRISCQVPAQGVQSAGIRAFLIVSDGVFVDTLNLSRRAVRLHSDAMTTPENAIVPLTSSGEPDDPGMRSCLAGLFSAAGNSYNRSKFRVFKWSPDASNAQSTDKWVEYASVNDTLFRCHPGALFWLITKNTSTIDFGRSKTVSLKSSYPLLLTSHNWTDVSVPFGFNVPLDAVIKASGPSAEHLVVYRWIPDALKKTYRAQMVYGGPSTANGPVVDTLFSGTGNGYTIFNPSDTAIQLRFPPWPVSMQTQMWDLSKSMQTPGYCVKVSASSENGDVGSVYCCVRGDRDDTLLIPEPPAFSSTKLCVRHPARAATGAIIAYPLSSSGLALFPLEIFNGNGRLLSARLTATLISADNAVNFGFVKSHCGGYERVDDGIATEVADGGREDFLMVTGARNRVEAFMGALTKPLHYAKAHMDYHIKNGRAFITLQHALPGQRWSLAVYNMQGKRIVQMNGHVMATGAQNFQTGVPLFSSGAFIFKSAFFSREGTISQTRRIVLP